MSGIQCLESPSLQAKTIYISVADLGGYPMYPWIPPLDRYTILITYYQYITSTAKIRLSLWNKNMHVNSNLQDCMN